MIDTLHIILPGLFYSIGDDAQNSALYPSLVKLLSKATVVPNRPACFEGVLKSHFTGLPWREIPAGALSALAHGVIDTSDKSNWLRADPAYLKADATSIYCLGNQHLDITEQERQALATSLNEFLNPEGIKLYALNKTWVMSTPQTPNITTNALADVEGKSIDPMLPSGPDAVHWHKLLTECQMLLNQHPVNIARQEKGLLPVNSLWFWGNGRLPEHIEALFDCIYSDNKIMKGLSKVAKIPCYANPEGFEALFDKMQANGYQMGAVIDSRIKRANNLTNIEQRKNILAMYEEKWFEPIEQSLIDGSIKSVYIDACDGKRFLISKRHFKYFWRKNQEVVSFVS